MKKITICMLGLVAALSPLAFAGKTAQPNIIYILADDPGYGDLNHAGGKVPTPHCDRLAAEEMRFMDTRWQAEKRDRYAVPLQQFQLSHGRHVFSSELADGEHMLELEILANCPGRINPGGTASGVAGFTAN